MGDLEEAVAPVVVTGHHQEQSVWKIIVVGDMNTGKTSIIERYCDDHFIEYYRPTTGESNV